MEREVVQSAMKKKGTETRSMNMRSWSDKRKIAHMERNVRAKMSM
jgi:hypothetical protein